MIDASVKLAGEPERNIKIPVEGKVSDGIRQLKTEATAVLTEYLTKHNLSKEEVNIMEEVISDDEGSPTPKKKKGVKRKKGSA